jgi:putative flippase GtrA
MSPHELFRFLVAGGWNTVFGYLVFAGLTYLLSDRLAHGYMVAAVLANIAAITNSYLTYKFGVFRTKGNYLREYLRFYLVYGGAAIASLAALPVVVLGLRWVIGDVPAVPYIAQAIIMPFVILYSYFGHKEYSFRT